MVVGVLYLERFSSSLYLKRGRGKKSVTPGYASDIFNAFLGNVR